MRPIKLEMNAFGPYKDKTIIDFDAMGERGLFLLTGDTGSGKTMIFDALTFALFGQSSGNDRHMTSFRSHHAKSTEETYVELTFSHKGEDYKIKRIPTQMYAKKEGRDPTQTMHQVELYLPNGDTISSVMAGNGKIQEILGIDYQQFTQVALIGQGEFRKLLNTDSKERSKIFRKIFNTGFYDKFQDELSRLNSNARKEYEQVITQIKTVFESLSDDEIEIERMDQILKTYHEALQNKQNEYKKLEKEYNTYQEKRIEENKILENQKALIEEFKSLAVIKKKLDDLKHQEKEINELELKLRRLDDALIHVDPLFKRLEELKNKLEKDANQLNTFKALLSSNAKSLENTHLEKEVLDKEKVLYEKYKVEIHALKESLTEYETLKKLHDRLLPLTSSLDKNKETLKGIEKSLESNQALKLELERKVRTKQTLKEELQKVFNTYSLLKELVELKSSISTLIKDLELSQKKLMDAQNKVEEKRKEYSDAEHIFYASQAGLLAKNLKEDEACPVCGSHHHPQKAQLSDESVSKEQLELLKKNLDSAIVYRDNISQNTSALQGRLDQNLDLFTQKQTGFEDVDKAYEEIIIKKESLETDLDKLKSVESDLENVNQKIEHLTMQKKEVDAKINEETLELKEVKTLHDQLKSRLTYESFEKAKDVLKSLENDVQDYEKRVDTYEERLKTLNAKKESLNARIEGLNESLETDSKQFETLNDSFKKALVEYEFKDVEDFEDILRLISSKDALQQKVRDFKETLLRESTRHSELEVRLKDKEMPDTSVQIQILKELEDLIKTQSDSMRTLSSEIEKESSSLKRLVVYEKRLIEKREAYQEINGLFRTANAQLSGKDRITFEFYVQTAYFTKVIHEANKRLSIMTQGRYAMVLREGSTDRRNVTGLDLDVIDFHTNKTREVSTLSGGESFKAALSLALGMSDVIQIFAGGIEIDMLFVDEGFGSLDQESLDQAIEVLNDLSSDHRLIGIISHVSELKERIHKQIIVHKDITGSSVELVV